MRKIINNNVFIWLTVLVVIGGIVSGSVLAAGGYGADEVEQAKDYTLEDMLRYALADEYLARAEYEAIMKEFGEQRPFSNIIKAEETHIEELLPLFTEYNIDVPEDVAKEHVVVPASIEEALEIGVQAEIDNIEMYGVFLEKDIPEDVKEIFANLKAGSEKHLEAFKNGLERGQNPGQGQNRGSNSDIRYGKSQSVKGTSQELGAGRIMNNDEGRYNSIRGKSAQGLADQGRSFQGRDNRGRGVQSLSNQDRNFKGRDNRFEDEHECDCDDCEEMSEGMKWFKDNEQKLDQ